jgi:hypothetical protein
MKRTTGYIIAIILLASCTTEYYAEPVYDARDRLIGYYDVEEFSETYNELVIYEMLVSKSRYARNEIILHDFYAAHTEVYAFVDHDRISIPLQVSGGYEFHGNGRIYRGELILNYRVKDLHSHAYVDYCEAHAFLH